MLKLLLELLPRGEGETAPGLLKREFLLPEPNVSEPDLCKISFSDTFNITSLTLPWENHFEEGNVHLSQGAGPLYLAHRGEGVLGTRLDWGGIASSAQKQPLPMFSEEGELHFEEEC